MVRPLTDAQARSLYEHGLTLQEIADEYDTRIKPVRTKILRAGGTMRPRGQTGRSLPCNPQRMTYVAMWGAGGTFTEIARTLSRSRQGVRAFIATSLKRAYAGTYPMEDAGIAALWIKADQARTTLKEVNPCPNVPASSG